MSKAAGAASKVLQDALSAGYNRITTLEKADIQFRNMGLSAGDTKRQLADLNDIVTGTSTSLADAARQQRCWAVLAWRRRRHEQRCEGVGDISALWRLVSPTLHSVVHVVARRHASTASIAAAAAASASEVEVPVTMSFRSAS
ncbi:hypothetical protein [Gordonia westfalica]|uniref:hypothetical protein n=1 Tax=Gordonia westfalica TaxID=158898 RepID=UPI0009424D04|nr:hypothetical protein [Gordonia westfalica]